MEGENLDLLISFLTICPNLKKLFITIDAAACYSLPRMGILPAHVRNKKKNPLLPRSKLVKLEGLSTEESEMLVATRLLELSGEAPPLIVATSNGSSYPRRLVKKGMRRKFVEEVMNCKHKHMPNLHLI